MSTFDDPGADELVSAVMDGVATPAEVDRVMGDPALQARLQEFRAVRAAIGETPEPLPAPTVDTAIAHALEAFDAPDVEGAPAEPPGWATLPTWFDHQGPGRPRPQPSTRRREPGRRARGRPRIPPYAIAAALVVLAGIGLFLALTARANHPASVAGKQSSTVVPRSDRSNAAGNTRAPAAAPTTAAGPPAPGAFSLGSFADQQTLSYALARLDPQTLRGATPPSAGGYVPSTTELNRCDVVIRGHLDRALTDRLAAAGATLEGQQVIVASYRAPASGTAPAGIEIIVANATSCYPVLTQIH